MYKKRLKPQMHTIRIRDNNLCCAWAIKEEIDSASFEVTPKVIDSGRVTAEENGTGS